MAADAFLQRIENYYPTYLAEAGWTDSLATKLAYYHAMQPMLKENPLPFIFQNSLVLEYLETLERNTLTAMKNEILNLPEE